MKLYTIITERREIILRTITLIPTEKAYIMHYKNLYQQALRDVNI